MSKLFAGVLVASLLAGTITPAAGQAREQPIATAILSFQERGSGARGAGGTVVDMLFASLAGQPGIFLVDRENMNQLLAEQELNLSGMVGTADAIAIGQLVGARILVTGSVMEVDRSFYLVARIIGTETSRVLGDSVKGKPTDALPDLVEQLARKVAQTLTERAGELIAKPIAREDRVAVIKTKLKAGERPTLGIRIEERHVGQAVIDPAAETEITYLARETGFPVMDPDGGGTLKADILITGEGFSEFAMRRGNLVSVKARLEVKAVDTRSDKIIAVDRQTAVVVDLTEQVAGKAALQEAAARIAERMLPKLAEDRP